MSTSGDAPSVVSRDALFGALSSVACCCAASTGAAVASGSAVGSAVGSGVGCGVGVGSAYAPNVAVSMFSNRLLLLASSPT